MTDETKTCGKCGRGIKRGDISTMGYWGRCPDLIDICSVCAQMDQVDADLELLQAMGDFLREAADLTSTNGCGAKLEEPLEQARESGPFDLFSIDLIPAERELEKRDFLCERCGIVVAHRVDDGSRYVCYPRCVPEAADGTKP